MTNVSRGTFLASLPQVEWCQGHKRKPQLSERSESERVSIVGVAVPLMPRNDPDAPGWGQVIMAARPLFPAPLPRGERWVDKGQSPLVFVRPYVSLLFQAMPDTHPEGQDCLQAWFMSSRAVVIYCAVFPSVYPRIVIRG